MMHILHYKNCHQQEKTIKELKIIFIYIILI